MDLKKALGKKKDEEEGDTVFFDMGSQESKAGENASPKRESVQSFSLNPETPTNSPPGNERPAEPTVQVQTNGSEVRKDDESSPQDQTVVNEQLSDLSSNLKNLVYDFRSFMSEAGSPFNPNDIPATKPESNQAAQAGSTEGRSPGYISAQIAGLGEREAVENPSDVESKLEEKLGSPSEKLHLFERSDKISPALSQLKDALGAVERGTKFSHDLKSNLDSADMPALIRAVNSTDYLLHAVGRKNLLKILEVGTREGWIRPEVERIVLSVAEILSTAGVEADDRIVNVNDLLRVVYFLNRLLDQEVSDFLALNQIAPARGSP